jgi:TctA family transporter
MNETGFRVNCEISHLMMTLSQRKVIITDSDNRDYITFTKCVNEADDSIFSFLTLKEVNILSK